MIICSIFKEFMPSATFFGHRDFNYSLYRDKLQAIIIDLIINHGVTEFYNGYRGNFDGLCAEIVLELKARYPAVKNILVLSYHRSPYSTLPKCFDESIYLLESSVPPRFAISYTNREIVKRADFIISGVKFGFGGACTACNFAKKRKKSVIDLFGNEIL